MEIIPVSGLSTFHVYTTRRETLQPSRSIYHHLRCQFHRGESHDHSNNTSDNSIIVVTNNEEFLPTKESSVCICSRAVIMRKNVRLDTLQSLRVQPALGCAQRDCRVSTGSTKGIHLSVNCSGLGLYLNKCKS